MSTKARLVAALSALLAALALAAVAVAANPHFLQAGASGPNNQGNLTVSFRMAGLGSNETITITATADSEAVYACRNGGNNFPSDPKKTEESGTVTASGNFTSGRNGQLRGSLTLHPPASGLECPPGQQRVVISVVFTDVSVSGGGDTRDIPGVFSKTIFDI